MEIGSLGAVLGLGFFLLASVYFSAIVSALATAVQDALGHAGLVLRLLDVASSLVLFTALFMVMFEFLPDVVVRWCDVAVGALVTAVPFVLGKSLIGLYLARAAPRPPRMASSGP